LVGNDYHVTIQDDDDSVAFKIQEKDVILISSTVTDPRNIRAELVNVAVPMMSWEMTLFDDFGWTGRRRNEDYGSATGLTIDIFDESHPIAAGLSGNIQVTDGAVDITWGLPNENARIVATVNGDTSKPVIFTYDTEDLMEKNMIAAARRAAFLFSDDNAIRLTEDGWKLFEAALEWAQQGTRLSVEDKTFNVPVRYELYQNYPNPFNPTTHILYSLKNEVNVSIKVYNTIGQLVATLVDQKQPYGIHSVQWNGRDDQGDTVGNGIYLYKMQVADFTQTHKMVLMR
jgi:hypothetical protein